MKVIASLVLCASVVMGAVVVNQIHGNDIPSSVDTVRQEGITDIPGLNVPPKQCKNVTVRLQDCTSIIVTRLPFLFNFMNLNQVCDCEDGALKCASGLGSSFLTRLQIPPLRVVYNANCKCKCPSILPDNESELTTVPAAGR